MIIFVKILITEEILKQSYRNTKMNYLIKVFLKTCKSQVIFEWWSKSKKKKKFLHFFLYLKIFLCFKNITRNKEIFKSKFFHKICMICFEGYSEQYKKGDDACKISNNWELTLFLFCIILLQAEILLNSYLLQTIKP